MSALTTCYIGKLNDERFLSFSHWNACWFARHSASLESIASTRSSSFNVRFARAGNQLAMLAPRQKRKIAAEHRESSEESNFSAFHSWIYLWDSNYFAK